MDQGKIHDEHPFATPVDLRDPARQLRGRMAAPVTILTAGEGLDRTGLTVSSLVVAEGEPPLVYCLLGATTDLYQTVEKTGTFIVHVCEAQHRTAADVFAGIRPSPGGMFAGSPVRQIDHGPVLEGFATRAACTVVSAREESYSMLVAARIDELVVGDLGDPLLYFRGGYRSLTPPR